MPIGLALIVTTYVSVDIGAYEIVPIDLALIVLQVVSCLIDSDSSFKSTAFTTSFLYP